jgi:class 3 adenylate cyclase
MDDGHSLKHLFQSLHSAVAVIDMESWSISFENANFFQWFPPVGDGEEPLNERMTDLDTDRAKRRITERGAYRFETEAKKGAKTISVGVEFKPLEEDGPSVILVECTDISAQKQSEYMLESYSKMVEKNTRDLEREKDRVEKLLLNIMPKSVYEEMKDYGTATPQRFESASVMLLDFVDFTEMAISRDPAALIAELNDIFSAFDRIVELFGCERIKTIGDAYMAVSGMPETNPDHAENIARVALRIRRYLGRRNEAHPQEWRCRIGINAGPLIGSIVGIQKYVYDIFGPGVNLAARMEALARPMGITLCEDLHELIKNDFMFTERGEEEVKGFGTKKIYTLEGERG